MDISAMRRQIDIRDEVETFLQVISPWERNHLLLNV